MPTHIVQRGGDLFLILRHPSHTSAQTKPDGEAKDKDLTAAPFSSRRSTRKRQSTTSTAKPKKKRNYGPKDHRIRVSSAQLIKSSPFFKRALTGGWMETARFKENRDVDVGAPDWNIDTLLVVMRLLHNNPRKLPTKPSFKLTEFSIIADYFQCRDAVLPYENRWKNTLLQSIPSRTDAQTWITGLWVALFFHFSIDFGMLSLDLLEHSDGVLDSSGLPLPQNILDTICDRRRIMLDEFITTMWRYRAALYDPLDMKVLNRFILDNNLVHAALPLPELTIHRLRREFEALDLPITWLGEHAVKELTPEGLSLTDWV
ncbi:hypothetical protein BJX65DRAFT_307793 [Aspergillus insuetus]